MEKLKEILNKSVFEREDILFLLNLNLRDQELLFDKANEMMEEYKHKRIYLRGLIEISNYCEGDCYFCDLSVRNQHVPRFRLSPEEIIEEARKLILSGLKTIILNSGEDSYFDRDMISYIIYSIKQISDVKISLSLGKRNFDDYKAWKYAGAENYIVRQDAIFKTQNKNERLKLYRKSLDHLTYLKSLGFSLGIINYIGLPNQTNEDIADEIILANGIDYDLAAFLPVQKNDIFDKITYLNTLKAIAILRILFPQKDIIVPGYFDKVDEGSLKTTLRAGGNIILFRKQLNEEKVEKSGKFIINSSGTIAKNYVKFRQIFEHNGFNLRIEKSPYSIENEIDNSQ